MTHKDGVSPEWPLKYADFEPYYSAAEKLYSVHGRRGDDPTEPPMSADYPFAPVSHEPRIQEIFDGLRAQDRRPFHLPLAVRLDENDPQASACIRCDTCDGFPCLVDAKADADVTCVRPALRQSAVTLVTEAKVTRLVTSESGREVTAVEAEVRGEPRRFAADAPPTPKPRRARCGRRAATSCRRE